MTTPRFAVMLLAASTKSQITGIDWFVIAIYFGILLGVAWWVVKKGKDSAADYFLAGRNLGWWIIGASIFASNIGSEHVVGLAGAGATSGVALAHYELHAWCLLVLAWVFVPFYMRSMVFTMPEFLERRFSPASRYVLSIVSIITFIVSKIAVGIFAGGVVFGTLLPELQITIGHTTIDSFWIGSVLVIVLTGLYTALGGMRAVAYNDAVQTFVLILGSASLTFYGLHKLGGWHELRYWAGSDLFNLWKPIIPAGVQGSWAPVLQTDPSGQVVKEAWYFNGNFPWPGMLICAPIIGLWYWCTDQYIVQRALGAPNESVARRGAIFASFLKLFPVYLFIIPGLICYALAKSGRIPELAAIIGPDGKAIPSVSQGAFPMLVQYLLPPGLRGTAGMVLVALAWIPVIKGASGLYTYLQAVQGYLAPPIFVVFFFGVFFKRLNAQGALWAMIVGFALGIFRMLVDTPVTLGLSGLQNGYPQGSFLWIVNNIYFQYFSVLITIVSAIVMVVVSHVTAEPDRDKIRSLTFETVTAEDRANTRASWSWREVAGSGLVLVCILGAYLYFRG